MSIEGFDYKDVALGTGDTNQYTFDFKIYEPTDLLIWVTDGGGNIQEEIRGDDTTFLAGLVFDSTNGGGTVTLVADLPDTWVMTFILAPDLPDQPTSFPNKSSFQLSVLEGALDFLASCVQRVAYLGQRAMVMHDLDDIDNFNPTIPLGIGSNPGGIISVKEDGSGFEIVITTGTLALAQSYATAAASSASASASSAVSAAASAVAAAQSAQQAAQGYSVTATRALPSGITAAGGFPAAAAQRNLIFAHGSPGAVVLSANPQIPLLAASIGVEYVIVGCDDTNTIKVTNGSGLDLNGDMVMGNGDTLGLVFDGTNWSETFRRSAT